MKCVIVGGGGFVGRHLGNDAARRGHGVLGLDLAAAPPGDALHFPVERRDVTAGEVALPAGTDVVYYLAQSPHHRVFPDRAGDLFAVNVAGALRVADAARRAGVTLFVYASTGTVYAPSFAPMTETDPVRRDHGYALSKLAAEEALALMGDPMQVLSARLFGVYGPDQPPGLVSGVAARVRDGRPVVIERNPRDPDDRDGLRISLTFVDDVVACMAALGDAALAGRALPGVLNVAAPDAVSIRRLAEAVGALAGRPVGFDETTTPRESDYIADVTRLSETVDVRFTAFEDALAATVGDRART